MKWLCIFHHYYLYENVPIERDHMHIVSKRADLFKIHFISQQRAVLIAASAVGKIICCILMGNDRSTVPIINTKHNKWMDASIF